jgi:hypothetical protein
LVIESDDDLENEYNGALTATNPITPEELEVSMPKVIKVKVVKETLQDKVNVQ